MKRRRLAWLIGATTLALAAPSAASGAVTVGQIAPTSALNPCGGATLFVTSVSGPPSYQVPSAGVLTSWSVRGPASSSLPTDLGLKVIDPVAPSQFRIVGQDSVRAIESNIVNTFRVRIPVRGDELIALWVPTGTSWCAFSTTAADVLSYRGGSFPEPQIGQTFPVNINAPGQRINVSAQLESDTDGDGYGDESQDQCPSQTSTQGACATPPDTDGPAVEITKGAPNRLGKSKVKFKFVSDDPTASFECKLKGKGVKPKFKQFSDCTSPRKYKKLDEGKHKFQVRASDPAGNVGAPAKDKFKVID